MKPHQVEIEWVRDNASFLNHRYTRVHQWRFDGGTRIHASASPEIVRLPFSDPSGVDPEEAFVASLASCHMLWFLDFAARNGYVVDRYVDKATGLLTAREDKRLWLSKVELHPHVVFSGLKAIDQSAFEHLHHRAHEECFLANAVRSQIVIAGTWELLEGEK